MKDEELAEEFANNGYALGCTKTPFESAKDGFLAGLKAGRLQWHKVADELPKEDDVYLIYTTEGYLLGHYEQGGADGKIDFCGEPYSDFTEYPSEEELMENDVIAWCEIPTFDKE